MACQIPANFLIFHLGFLGEIGHLRVNLLCSAQMFDGRVGAKIAHVHLLDIGLGHNGHPCGLLAVAQLVT